ncbi:MAG TPA: acyl-CoA dehydrogenase family protein [Acidimicrobiales bacterium]|nr:acyl-CoA dehydrogenase family protein [Acidimicrobiales bacterium]
MDFELSDDQLSLQTAAASLLGGTASSQRVRAAMREDGGYDRELWEAMAEQGWMGVEAAEEGGGLGLGAVEAALLCEQVGRHAAPVPYLPLLVARRAIADAADAGSAFAEHWAGLLGQGEKIACAAWNPERGCVLATQGPAGWSLAGDSGPVVAAPEADLCVVVATVAEGLAAGERAVFALPMGDALRPRPEPSMDRTRSLGWLRFDDTEAQWIGDSAAVDLLLDRAATLASAQLLGGANRVLEMSVEYAKTRIQFGRPIGSFQAVKHRCADMLVDVEGMRSGTYYAAWCVSETTRDAPLAASSAKAWCSDASRRVCSSGLQVHGGVGFTWDHDLHIYMKRSQLDEWSFGSATFHLDRVAGILRARVEAGEPVL